jgi:large subunit ribosomal protein L15
VDADVIDLLALKAANVVALQTTRAKVFASGEITKAVKLKGVDVTKGAREAIEKAGGSVEE